MKHPAKKSLVALIALLLLGSLAAWQLTRSKEKDARLTGPPSSSAGICWLPSAPPAPWNRKRSSMSAPRWPDASSPLARTPRAKPWITARWLRPARCWPGSTTRSTPRTWPRPRPSFSPTRPVCKRPRQILPGRNRTGSGPKQLGPSRSLGAIELRGLRIGV